MLELNYISFYKTLTCQLEMTTVCCCAISKQNWAVLLLMHIYDESNTVFVTECRLVNISLLIFCIVQKSQGLLTRYIIMNLSIKFLWFFVQEIQPISSKA